VDAIAKNDKVVAYYASKKVEGDWVYER
jgi:hypothetical protein